MSSLAIQKIAEDKIKITIGSNWIEASARELEALIRELAKARASIAPEVERILPDGRITGEVNPTWAIPVYDRMPDKTLMIRHSGLEWLSFQLEGSEARILSDRLRAGTSEPNARNVSLQ